MSVASWCCTCFSVVLCVSFCTGHVVMVPLTYLHCLQHSLFEHLFNLYSSEWHRWIVGIWLRDYLCDRKQRVILSGAMSDTVSTRRITAEVPQGSTCILGPLLFLVYSIDIVTDIHSPIHLFANDTTLYIEVDDPQRAADSINADLAKIHSWANSWLVTFNPLKTESLLFSRKTNPPAYPNLYFTCNNTPIQEVSSHKQLGVVFSNNCSWHDHIDSIKTKAWKRINLMRPFKFTLDRKSLEVFYFSFIRPILELCWCRLG